MLINRNNNETKHVNFVSYTGEWPNLCSGVLTLEIDGKEITFGYGFNSKDESTYSPFWSSGGGLMPNYDGAWQDGFIIKKEIANFYYCYGLSGGCFVFVKDLRTGNKVTVSRAR